MTFSLTPHILPPFGSKVTVTAFVQCAYMVMGLSEVNLNWASISVPPAASVNQPSKM